jgi:cytochrome c oxidase subunit 2
MRRKQLLLLCAISLTGCSGVQSALAPAGRESEQIATLFWWMTGVSLVIWSGVIGLAVYATRVAPRAHEERRARYLIYAGAAIPSAALALLLIYGHGAMANMVAPAPENALRISVTGEQWWWRVRYEPPRGQPFEMANEVRLPAGMPVEFLLQSRDVIHSFWIPSLGGKMDMIPGRVNRLVLHPEKPGEYRGACAEYCGTAHAKMAFLAKVMPPGEFQSWLDSQSRIQGEQGAGR